MGDSTLKIKDTPTLLGYFYKFKKTTRNEKWEKVKILKKQLKKHLLKLKKKKKQKRNLKKLIDNYAKFCLSNFF